MRTLREVGRQARGTRSILTQPEHVVGQFLLHGRVPRSGPPDMVEQLVDQTGREPPQDEVLVVPDQEARAAVADGVYDGHAVLRVEQLLDRDPEDGVDLAPGRPRRPVWAASTSRGPRSPRSCSAGARARAGSRRPRRRPGRARSPPRPRAGRPPRAETSVSSIFPPGKLTWPGWERMSWARSVSSRSGPCGALAEQHQHRAPAGVGARRGHEPADVLGGDGAGALADGLEPVGKSHQPDTLRCAAPGSRTWSRS